MFFLNLCSDTSIFTMVQFGCQMIFLMVMVGLGMGFRWNDVTTAQASQAINTFTIIISFYFGWKLMPKVGARHVLPEGKRLLLQGFRQNWNTAKRVNRDFKKGLRWYLLALVFAEAAANSFTTLAVVFLGEQLGLNGTQIGIFFLIAMFGIIPGGVMATYITNWTNPNTSWRLSMVVMFVLAVVGGLVLNRDNVFPIGYIWGLLVGLMLGWFYPTENLFFSMIIPKGQEAELAGFFVYCTQIIGWLPPLIFTALVESNVDQGVGLISVSSFAIISALILCMASSWPEIVEDVRSKDVDVAKDPCSSTEEGPEAEEKDVNATEQKPKEVMSVELGNSRDVEMTSGGH